MTILRRLELTNLRCFSQRSDEFEPGLNLIVGANGAGKTSLLESIHLLLRQRSFRTHSNNDLVCWGQDEALVVGRFTSDTSSQEQIVGLSRNKDGFVSRLNGESVERRAHLVEKFPLITITPGTTVLVSGGPGERRQYLDQTMFHVEHQFLKIWQNYRSTLSQRNALLRSGKISGIEVWDAQLVLYGQQLHAIRQKLVDDLVTPLQQCLSRLQQDWQVDIQYRSGWGAAWGDDQFGDALADCRDHDIRRAVSTRGPHRAELKITSDGKPVAESLSRGQQRILAIALLVAQMQLLSEKSTNTPLVLVDDIGAELDHSNANKVIDLCASFGGQLLVTALEAEPYVMAGREAAMFHVEH